MILNLIEITPGLVAYLDPSILREFELGGPYLKGIHPFVCLDVKDDLCVWAALSSSSLHGMRHRIDPAFKVGRTPSWINRDTFIYGPDYCYRGPRYVFQEASRKAERSLPNNRNSVTQMGLRFIKDHTHDLTNTIGVAT